MTRFLLLLLFAMVPAATASAQGLADVRARSRVQIFVTSANDQVNTALTGQWVHVRDGTVVISMADQPRHVPLSEIDSVRVFEHSFGKTARRNAIVGGIAGALLLPTTIKCSGIRSCRRNTGQAAAVGAVVGAAGGFIIGGTIEWLTSGRWALVYSRE